MGERENKYVSECERVKKKKFFVFIFIFFNQSVTHAHKRLFFIITQNSLYTPRHRRM